MPTSHRPQNPYDDPQRPMSGEFRAVSGIRNPQRRFIEETPRSKGLGLGHWLTVAAFGLFACYAFNVGGAQETLDASFQQLVRSLRVGAGDVDREAIAALPVMTFVLCVLGVWIVGRLLIAYFHAQTKAAMLAGRASLSVDQFIRLAEGQGISRRVAREAYWLLKPHYAGARNKGMRAELSDDLSGVLHLSQVERANLLCTLLRDTDRLSISHPEDEDVETVLDLLRNVESTASRFL